MANNEIPKSVRCSFCGKTQENVKKIVAGPGVYICDECVELCTSIIEAELYDDEKAGYTVSLASSGLYAIRRKFRCGNPSFRGFA